MPSRWRIISVLVVAMLVLGATNILLLHILSSHPSLDSSGHQTLASARSAWRRASHVSHSQSHSEPDKSEPNSVVIYPVSEKDQTISAVVAALEELDFQIIFCQTDLPSCVGAVPNLRDGYSLLWLKTEGEEVQEQVFAGAESANAFGIGWHIWSRRSLCLEMQRNRAEFKSASFTYIPFYPDCLALPSQLDSSEASAVLSSTSQWIVHGTKSQKNQVFPSAQAALSAQHSGVLHQYVSPPLTFHDRKFSLFAYAAVTSLNPLRAYIFQDAHTMLAHHPYSESSAAQSTSEAEAEAMLGHGGLWGSRGAMQAFNQTGISPTALWRSVEDAVAIALLSAATAAQGRQEDEASAAQRSHFKLLGAHIVFDSSLRPFVIKLDPSPPMRLRRNAAGGVSPGSKLRKTMLTELLKVVGVGQAAEEGSGDGQLRRAVVECVSSMGAGSARAKQLQGKHLDAIVELERERRRVQRVRLQRTAPAQPGAPPRPHDGSEEAADDDRRPTATDGDRPPTATDEGWRQTWAPLYPVAESVERVAAQVRGGSLRRLDTLLRWWEGHGRARCLHAEQRPDPA